MPQYYDDAAMFDERCLKRYGVLLCLIVLNGCGSGISLRQRPQTVANTYPHASPGRYTDYEAYGDSITAGYGLADPAREAYPALVAKDRELDVRSYAISAEQACDVMPHQVLPNWVHTTSVSHVLYSLLIGTNDVGEKGTGAYEAVFNTCDRAAISWLAIPPGAKVLAEEPGALAAGAGHFDSFGSVKGWTTSEQGASISFTIVTSQRGPIYAWPGIEDTSSGTYSYSLDGVPSGTGAMRTVAAIATYNGTNRSLGFLRLPVVDAGRHVVTFLQTSTGAAGGITIVGIGAPAASTPLPTVLVGTIPYQLLFRGSAPCSRSELPCETYNRDIASSVELLAADGLDIRLFDTRAFMLGNPSEMQDVVHPNAAGQMELAESVESVF